MTKSYFIFYETSDGNYRCLNSETEEIKTLETPPRNTGAFHIMKGYEPTDEGLKKVPYRF